MEPFARKKAKDVDRQYWCLDSDNYLMTNDIHAPTIVVCLPNAASATIFPATPVLASVHAFGSDRHRRLHFDFELDEAGRPMEGDGCTLKTSDEHGALVLLWNEKSARVELDSAEDASADAVVQWRRYTTKPSNRSQTKAPREEGSIATESKRSAHRSGSTVYTTREAMRGVRSGKDGAGVRGAAMKALVGEAWDEARAASDALEAAEGKRRKIKAKRKTAAASDDDPPANKKMAV
jgi:hypothetical protein